MELSRIKACQQLLRRPSQLAGLVSAVLSHKPISRVLLLEDPDGFVLIGNGHHRVLAYWLAGHRELYPDEYVLVQTDISRPMFGGLQKLWERTCLS